jgi:iron(III) transport system permease protein
MDQARPSIQVAVSQRLPIPDKSICIMAVILLTLGFFLLYPVALLLVQSFNVAPDIFVGSPRWGLDNWREAFQQTGLFKALGNTLLVWCLSMLVSFPISVAVAWALARTRVRFSQTLEFMFWVAFMLPGVSTTIAWITLLDPELGLINVALGRLPFIQDAPFNIFSVPGIVWVHVVTNGIPIMVMLLTPAFRNMDAALEEAARVSGGNNLRTMLRVTLPLMASPMVLVFALKLLRVFQTFEIEQLLGTPMGFFVYSTYIYNIVQSSPPAYGQANVLASVTLLLIALIIPLQRWILQRRRYTTISGKFKPGLIDLGSWQSLVLGAIVLLVALLTVVPVAALVVGSFMTRAGFFELGFSLSHWRLVFGEPLFFQALRTTFILAISTAIISPLLFSMLAYIMVRTRWRGRTILDSVIWVSGAVPGILSGLGLLLMFLGTPGLNFFYGTIWALLIVVILQGNTTGTNMSKAAIVQIGEDMEEAARIAGAGWLRTYFRIWIPLLMPTLALLGMMNFVIAAGATGSIVLLASRDTTTLSLLALEFGSPGVGYREEATIISLFIVAMAGAVAITARKFALRLGVQHGST